MPAYLLQLLLRALPLLGGFGGSFATRAGIKALPASLSLLKKPGVGFLADILGFAAGETLAENIPGTPSSGQGFLERLPLLAAGFGGGHLAGQGLKGLLGKKGFGFLGKPGKGKLEGTTVARFIPEQVALLGGFTGGHEAGRLFLPQSEHEDEAAQESMLLGNVDSRNVTQSDEEAFLELLQELQFQSEEEQSVDPELIQQIMNSVLSGALV